MKKSNLFVVLFLLCVVVVYASGGAEKSKETIAVMPFTGLSVTEGNLLADLAGNELQQLGSYQIAPRTAAINAALKEQSIQRQGFTDTETISELGKGANADYVVSGHVQTLGGTKIISASIINVETFQQIAGDYIEYTNFNRAIDTLPDIMASLINGLDTKYKDLPILAVLPFEVSEESSESDRDVLAQILAIQLANSGKYAVVSRTTATNAVMSEHNIQRNQLTDESSIKELGKALNAEYVLSGTVAQIEGNGFISVTIIDIEKFTQEASSSATYYSLGDGVSALADIATDLTGEKNLGGHSDAGRIQEKKIEADDRRLDEKMKNGEFVFSPLVHYTYMAISIPEKTTSNNETKMVTKTSHHLFSGIKLGYRIKGVYIPNISAAVDMLDLETMPFVGKVGVDMRFAPARGIGIPMGLNFSVHGQKVEDEFDFLYGLGFLTGLECRFNSYFSIEGFVGGTLFLSNFDYSQEEQESTDSYSGSIDVGLSFNFFL